ncbi:cation/H(+) antiporter 15-like [Trifolium pratense]|uniref:cation/H(+) antiporter 15-like n=1 Tax=Trifolium pratense TaxID=57577 RepID=UPI001E694B31|nr:cation/H(+) antiporter 15-like [Trifolium pratense]
MAETRVNASITDVTNNGTIWICEHMFRYQRSKGIFFYDNPFSFTLPVLFLQTTLVSVSTTILQLILEPIGTSSFFPQLLAGLVLGPSVIGQNEFIKKWLFPPKTFYISETIAFFGSMMYMFLIGVKIDISSVTRTGKKAWAIGIFSFIIPLMLSLLIALFLRKTLLTPDKGLYESIFSIVFIFSTGSFHVTTILLADLKLLSSEMGRLAISSSLISGFISILWVTCLSTLKQSETKKDNGPFNWMTMSFIVMILVIIYVLRPIMLWMIRKTPEGKPIKESYIFSVFLMVLSCALFGEYIGQHFMIGPIVFGMAVPDGPPLGSALTEKLDALVSTIFLPLYFLYSGIRFDLYIIDAQSFAIVQVVGIVSSIGKIVGTLLPSIYWKMPFTDVLSLGLLMSTQGITQLLYLQSSLHLNIIDEQSYGNALIALLWLTGATTPIIKFLYEPSKRYLSLNRRTIEQSTSDIELRLMACIHTQDDTSSIINLLEMSNPSLENPICFYVLHLLQLKGRSAPLFIDHQPSSKKLNAPHSNHSQNIINAFRSYEKQKSNNVVVKVFTTISPYETMHDEICMQVDEKRVCLLIVPFHRQWRPTGVTESAQPIRALNRHLLRMAPCSVGILIERGTLCRNNPLTSVLFYSVGIVFIEGADDREALAYAMRMANHPNVRITLVRLMEPRKKNRNLMHRDPDGDLIHRFKVECIQIKRHDYREEIVRDSVEMINVIRSLDGCFDLVLVGRRHATESNLFSGLTEWNEFPELGPIGDMLVASDSTFDGSVLVIQQQKRSGVGYHDLSLDSGINTMQESITIVEVPRERKVWPIA